MNRAAAQPQSSADLAEVTGPRSLDVIVAGASGYAGALAASLLWRHPRFELSQITARSDVGTRLDALYPRYRVPIELTEFDTAALDGVGAAIVAYPHGASGPVVRILRERQIRVVDLSAAFRLRDPEAYRRWYGEHDALELLGEAVYGLPELYRDEVRSAGLVANPGCYPTATVLALAPLAAAGLIADVVIDAKSGVSGAGRGGGERTQFVTIGENTTAYGVGGHRHLPEITQELASLGAVGVPITFLPHLVPIDQGELVSCYVTAAEPIDPEAVLALYEARYGDEPFVEIVDEAPGVRDVRDTNICRIHVSVDPSSGRILALAAIDNLWKGAASQAVQNLNLMYGLPEGEGIS